MWEKIRVVFTIPELRGKIFFTLGMLAIYRLGFHISLPIADQEAMNAFAGSAGGLADVFKTVAIFSGSALNQATIFGLGIMPYISASIIFQLLGSVYPPLAQLQKEVHGNIELLPSLESELPFVCYVNDEGKLKNMSNNPFMGWLNNHHPLLPHTYVYGPVVLFGGCDDDGNEVTPEVPQVTDEWAWGADVPLATARLETRRLFAAKHGRARPKRITNMVGKDI